MKRLMLSVFMAGVMMAGSAVAKEVNLDIGETFRQGDLTVTCGTGTSASSGDAPLSLQGCQYWDNFNRKCLFEKTTYIYKNLECVEECQHWDKFNSTCLYQSKCTFYPPQKSFVQTSCDKFDDFNNTCLQTKDRKIGR